MNNKEKNFISAVIYVNNAENGIEHFLKNIISIFSSNFQKYEIICVNDGSLDKSVEKIKTFSKTSEDFVLTIINMSYYHGLETAMKAGVDFAIGDFVYEFDSIFIDYDTKLIIDVYTQSLKGFDIVSASSNSKKVSSKIFYKLFNQNSKSVYNLQTETFRIISRRGINRVQAINKTIPYRKAIYSSCGLSLSVLKYNRSKKSNISSKKQSKNNKYKLASDSLILFTDLAYKFSIGITIVFLLFTIFAAVYAIAIYINKEPIAGWTTTLLFLAFSFFGVFAILAIVINYLSILVNLVFKKQDYLIESVEKITK